MGKATAHHILVNTKEECVLLKQQIEDGADFVEIAKEYSTCAWRISNSPCAGN